MTPERYRQIGELYHAALELDANERTTFLERACAGDAELRQKVESLLNSNDQAKDFIEAPALAVAAEILADDADSLKGRMIARYRILSLLGAGGMGRVYLAEDTGLSRHVALKLLPEYFTHDKKQVRRFRQEARAASALNHPNILTVHEVGQVDGTEFIATEYVDGQTLRTRLALGPLELREAINIAAQVAAALVAAHEAGIVHRDIKPENIMLRPDGFIKVLDFGLAKLAEQRVLPGDTEVDSKMLVNTTPGTIMGTVSYMSPEQARGLAVDARTDVWSLGVVLYEMVNRHKPFEGTTTSDVLASILTAEPPSLHQSALEAPSELQRIASKTLCKDKEERYKTSRELLNDLTGLKQQLEFEAQLGRSQPPEIRGESQQAGHPEQGIAFGTTAGRLIEASQMETPSATPTL